MNHQVGIIELNRNLRAVALHGVEKGSADVHIQRVAEFIKLRGTSRFDAGREVARIMPSKAALAERREQIFERLESQEIQCLVGNFKTRFDVRLSLAHLT